MTVKWSDLGLSPARSSVRDLWRQQDLGKFADQFQADRPPPRRGAAQGHAGARGGVKSTSLVMTSWRTGLRLNTTRAGGFHTGGKWQHARDELIPVKNCSPVSFPRVPQRG